MVLWQRLAGTTETKVGWRTVTRKRYRFPNGREADFDVFGKEGGQGAAILAFTPDGRVVISEQYRAGSDQSMLELPGGYVDDGEDPKQSAIRELLEETGYAAENIELLGISYPEPYTHMKVNYYIGTNAKKVAEPQHEPNEFINVCTITAKEFMAAAHEGKTSNVPAALFAYEQLMDYAKESFENMPD